MPIGYEFSEKEEYDLIPDGDYEVILEDAQVKAFKKDPNKQYLSLKFVIRQDVEQGCCGRAIFESVFKDKTNPDQFDHRKLQKIILTQKGKDTFQNKFANEDELIQYINGLTMQIHISLKEPDEYHDSSFNEVKFCSYKPSTVKLQEVGPKNTPEQKANLDFLDFTDSDLPF